MSGIWCFMHRKTPRRLVLMTRSKSASLMSVMGVGRSSTPALLKAVAVALPMPEPAPVTNATFPENLPLLFVVKLDTSDGEQRLDGAAFVHGAVALGDLVEREGEVEHLAGVDLTAPDEVDQLGKEAADGCGTAVQVDVGEEQLVAGEVHVVTDADVADVPAGPGGADGLHHRLLGADGFDHR